MQLDGREKADLTTIEKVMLMVCNQPHALIKEMFPNHHLSYIETHLDEMKCNFCKWWGRLDAQSRLKVVNISDTYYSNEARRRVESY
jgi:hypothetical protein